MKYSKLKELVEKEADNLELLAGQQGESYDGGKALLLRRLVDFKLRMIVAGDLRPSEYSKLNAFDVGEPFEFSEIIEKYKLELVKAMVSKIEL